MKKTTLLITVCAFLLAACGSVALAGPTPTPTVDSQATANALETEQAQKTRDAQATADAFTVTADARATSAAQTEAAITPTIAPVFAQRTANAEEVHTFVESLHDAGYISSTSGVNLRLDGYVSNKAKINYFDWSFSNYSPANFVFRSDIEWQSASETANWFSSGCGIVFREYGNGGNFYVLFLYLDGNAELFAYGNNQWSPIASQYYGKLDVPEGKAELIVSAENDHILVFVNSKLVIDVIDTRHSEGNFGFTISSGTNKDFGTRCNFTDVLLWELDSEQ